MPGREAIRRRLSDETRQFNRLRKAQVKCTTYLDTHTDLLGLVLPKEALLAAVATRGEWGLAQEAIQTLLASGPLGKTLFTFAGFPANPHSFQNDIEKLLQILAKEKFTKIKVDEFKAAAAAKTSEFQVL